MADDFSLYADGGATQIDPFVVSDTRLRGGTLGDVLGGTRVPGLTTPSNLLGTQPIGGGGGAPIGAITPGAGAIGGTQTPTKVGGTLDERLRTPDGREAEVNDRIAQAGGITKISPEQLQNIVNTVYDLAGRVESGEYDPAASSPRQGGMPFVVPLPIDPAVAALLTAAGLMLGRGGGGAPSGSTGGAGTGAGSGAGAGTGAVDTTGGGAGSGAGNTTTTTGGGQAPSGTTGGGQTTSGGGASTTSRGTPEGVAQIDRSTVGGAAAAVLGGPISRTTTSTTPTPGPGGWVDITPSTGTSTSRGTPEGGVQVPNTVLVGFGTPPNTTLTGFGGAGSTGGVIGGGTTGGGTTGGGTTGGGSTGGGRTGGGDSVSTGGGSTTIIGTGNTGSTSSGGNISFTINPAVATPITVRTPDLNRDLLREGRISSPALRETAASTLGSYGMLAGQPGQYDVGNFANLLGQLGAYNPQLTQIATQQTIEGQRALREANIADVQRLSQAAMEAQRAANPELYSTLGSYLPAAQGMLASDLARLQGGGRLTAEEIRSAQQSAREAGLARGREMDQSTIAAEVLNRDALMRAREAQARTNVQQSMQNVYGGIGAAQAATFNPFATLLGQQYGMQTANIGSNQALFGQGTGFTSGQFSNPFVQGLVNPYSAYAQDVYGSNFNAANARAIAEANANAAAQGANQQLIGNLAGKVFEFAIPEFGKLFGRT